MRSSFFWFRNNSIYFIKLHIVRIHKGIEYEEKERDRPRKRRRCYFIHHFHLKIESKLNLQTHCKIASFSFLTFVLCRALGRVCVWSYGSPCEFVCCNVLTCGISWREERTDCGDEYGLQDHSFG